MKRHHPRPPYGGSQTIGVDELQTILTEQQRVTVLDVRTAEDRAEWAIPGSIHVAAYDALKSGDPQALAAAAIANDAPVVTVCGAGNVSLVAMQQLQARGYEARSLAGGMKAWSLAWNSAEVPVPGSPATVVQVRRTGKGCLSHLIGNDGEAVVIDAALPTEVYQRLAAEHGWVITGVHETHIHADHLSRSRQLAEATGAPHWLPEQDRVSYPFGPVRDGDRLAIGDSRIVALRTPGHTPESTCYLLDGQALFSGDTLFLAGVGRPDLEASAGEAHERARRLHASLHRVTALPPETLILPGHSSSPVAFNGEPVLATLGEVVARVEALRLSEDAFVETILARIPPAPPNHARIVAINEGREQFSGDPTDLEAGANRCAVS